MTKRLFCNCWPPWLGGQDGRYILQKTLGLLDHRLFKLLDEDPLHFDYAPPAGTSQCGLSQPVAASAFDEY